MSEHPALRPATAPEAGEDQDRSLVAQVLAGQLEAFEELVRRHDRRIYRVTLAITQNKEDAEDAMQDAFLKALEHLDQFAGNARFSTWLTRIAVNEALQRLRRRGRFDSLDEPVEVGDSLVPQQLEDWRDNPEQQYAKEELRSLLEKAIGSLPAIYRTVFMLRDVEHLDNEEAAAMLDLSVPAIKSRLLRARLMMRERLARHFAVASSGGP
jgi:RNA polymerase sigma-70 factor (ECF subfamily)